MTDHGAGAPPAPPATAATVFGDRLPVAAQYVELLATAGVQRGLIGPREVPRLWERHVLNCAVLTELLSPEEAVVDIGSGAGLPGMVLAVRNPALQVTLVEPLARRVLFLREAVEALGLGNVAICRGRAEDLVGQVVAPVATARAVAPLDRLAGWALPLVAPGGRLLAIKGRSAEEEIVRHAAAVHRAGGIGARVLRCGTGLVDPPAIVVEISRGSGRAATPRKRVHGRVGRGHR